MTLDDREVKLGLAALKYCRGEFAMVSRPQPIPAYLAPFNFAYMTECKKEFFWMPDESGRRVTPQLGNS